MVIALAWTRFDSGNYWIEVPGAYAMVEKLALDPGWLWELHIDDQLFAEGESPSAEAAQAAVIDAINRSEWDWPILP